MKNISAVIIFLFLFCIIADIATTQSSKTLTLSDLSIANISIKANKKQIKKILGTPRTIKIIPQPESLDPTKIRWTYPHLDIYFRKDGRIDTLILNDPHYSTSRGVKVGDSADKMKIKYGDQRSLFDDEHYISFFISEYEDIANPELCGISFSLEDNVIKTIRIGYIAEY
jgi:hypothetical protein